MLNTQINLQLKLLSGGLSYIIPSDLHQMIVRSTEEGLLASFLLTISGKITTDYLKAHQYSADEIYWINQIMRGLLAVAVGKSFGTSASATIGAMITVAITNHYLTEYAGSQPGVKQRSLIMMSGIGASFVGGQIVKYVGGIVQNRFFSSVKKDEKPDNLIGVTCKLVN